MINEVVYTTPSLLPCGDGKPDFPFFVVFVWYTFRRGLNSTLMGVVVGVVVV